MTPVTTVFEREGKVYLVAPVLPITPSETEIEEYAFSKAIKDGAPNPNLLWLKGQYVEADKPNLNGAMWLSSELAVASLTPMLMPVTVMHDPATAVGLIADTRLLLPGQPEIPRSRIDTTLAIWQHRFPDVAEETLANYHQGSLMQSMECLPSHYDCQTCGKSYPKLPGGAEEANWCPHLRGEEGAKAARILRGVCFTGTGLIFGTRGAKGAYTDAHLDVFQDEVAEFHEKAQRDKSYKPQATKRSKTKMEVTDERYAELVAAEARLKEVEPKLEAAETEAAKVPDLTAQVDRLEVEKKTAEDTAKEEKEKREGLEEQARSITLASERIGKLGSGFREKLPESIATRLDEQAKTLSDEDWTARLDELAELVGVAHDAKKDGEEGDDDETAGKKTGTFTREEVARSGAGASKGGGNGDGDVSPARRQSVVAGLVKATSKS